MPRYAVYWLPEPDHPLWAAGCHWLGRDPSTTHDGAPPPDRAEPWRYGFHATLKAPITLAEDVTPEDLVSAVRALAADTAPIGLPPMAVGELDGFVALLPTTTPPELRYLADRCVATLDRFRAPMAAAEVERRAQGLDAPRRTLLTRWGYPHVFEHWRLHLTLSDRLPDARTRAAMRREAEAAFAVALTSSVQVASLSVLVEPAPGQPFRLFHRSPCAGQRPARR